LKELEMTMGLGVRIFFVEDDDLSQSGEKLFRRAINRFYRMRKEK
jgi:hypothetical protein